MDLSLLYFTVHFLHVVSFEYGSVGSFGYSQGSGPILAGYLYCNGDESNLVECSQNYRYTSLYCYHYEDVALKCEC